MGAVELFDASAAAQRRVCLTFRLGSEEYGIDILRVQEIRGYERPTRVAHAPDFVKGVVNLRGVIVPVVDLRLKFGLHEVRYDALTVVIVLNVGHRVVGIVVDSVSDVVDLAPEQVRPAPEVGSVVDPAFIDGLGAAGERMLILIDIERMMAAPDMSLAEALA